MRKSAGYTGLACQLLMNAGNRVIVFFRRKNAGIKHYQQYYSGKDNINNKIRLFTEPYPWTSIIPVISY
jgi:hypothetical protein